ncbi:MAG: 7-cyano-7-deazaguanine synthase QueC [Pseudomonadota bacterium]|nr:7-cyano-7-deazaguanine synthase QueC [Pseudomonadota bacterium]
MNANNNSRSIVLFSGGQDSATCLAWALNNFGYVETIGFNYGQTHAIELSVREDFLKIFRKKFPNWAKKLGPDRLVDMSFLSEIIKSTLTGNSGSEIFEKKLPLSFVPGRNLLFLNTAASYGYDRRLRHLVIGAGEVDFSGYPDCKRETLAAMSAAIKCGIEEDYEIHSPLMDLTKAKVWKLAYELGGRPLVNLILEVSHTCYLGNRKSRHEWGYGCGKCDACRLRAEGWFSYRQTAAGGKGGG